MALLAYGLATVSASGAGERRAHASVRSRCAHGRAHCHRDHRRRGESPNQTATGATTDRFGAARPARPAGVTGLTEASEPTIGTLPTDIAKGAALAEGAGTTGMTQAPRVRGSGAPSEATGPTGSSGPTGPTGATEADGSTGASGASGATGIDEAPGEAATTGPIGPTDPIESTGPTSATGSTDGPEGPTAGSGARWWDPPQRLTWRLQLQGTVNGSEPVEDYDVDGFETGTGEVAALHAGGAHVTCYIDVGTAEEWRPDHSSFPASVLGTYGGWPGERWLDIRQLSILEPIMSRRLEMCKAKGFDAIDPDNMDGYENATGFPLTAADQLAYNEWVAHAAHALGLAVFQKNDDGQVPQLEPYFDGELSESCNEYHECARMRPYLAAGKPVLDAEYGLSASQFCAADNAAGIMGARYSVALDGSIFEPCW
jgi:hypothetical protein